MFIALVRVMTHHTVLWIDQNEAKIFRLDAEGFSASMIENAHHHVRRHPEAIAERSHLEDAQRYYREVASALHDTAELLVVGPSTAKLGFIKYVHKHDHGLEPKIVGVETVDHPTDGQLVAYARKYFRAADRMR
jgi:stalled ribosome rescue protein Dom34